MPVDFWYYVARPVWVDLCWDVRLPHWAVRDLLASVDNLPPALTVLRQDSPGGWPCTYTLPWLLSSGNKGAAKFLDTLSRCGTDKHQISSMLSSIWKTIVAEKQDTAPYEFFLEAIKNNVDIICHCLSKASPFILMVEISKLQIYSGISASTMATITTALAECKMDDCFPARSAIKAMVDDVLSSGHAQGALFINVLFWSDTLADFIPHHVRDTVLADIGTHSIRDLYIAVCVNSQLPSGIVTGQKNATSSKKQTAKSGIAGWNAEDEQAYQLALSEGQQIIPHARLLLCGPGRSGKSSVERSLVDEPFEKRSDSTIGVELQTAVCTIGQRDGKFVWRKEADQKMQHLLMVLISLNKAVQRKAIEDRLAQQHAVNEETVFPVTESMAAESSLEQKMVQSSTPSSSTTGVRSSEDSGHTAVETNDTTHDVPAGDNVNAAVAKADSDSPSVDQTLVASCTNVPNEADVTADTSPDAKANTTPETTTATIGNNSPIHDTANGVASTIQATAPNLQPLMSEEKALEIHEAEGSCATPDSPYSPDPKSLEEELSYAAMRVDQFIADLKYTDVSEYNIKDLDELVFLDIWDFAGQRLFSALQHMVLSSRRCAYAVVFDASKQMEKVAEPTLCRDGEEYRLDNSQGSTNFDIMESWLNTIHHVIGDDPDVPVYAIGTHIDKLPRKTRQQSLNKMKKYIWTNAEERAYGLNLDEVVFVDNTVAGSRDPDGTIVRLRKDFIEKLEPQFKQPIPIRWLPFTIGTKEVAKKFKCPWLTIEQIYRLANTVCGGDAGNSHSQSVDVEAMLKYQHHLGHILYYPENRILSSKVIIDVEWLLRIASLLFCPEPKSEQGKRLRKLYELLTSKGILLERLIIHRWQQHSKQTAMYTKTEEQRDYLYELMEQSGLMYNTKTSMKIPDREEESRKFYVPALVSRMPEDNAALLLDDSAPTIYLYTGSRKYLPQTLFWCAVVRCMQKYQPRQEPLLYQSAARLRCYGIYWLVLEYFSHGIRISIAAEESALSNIGSAYSAVRPADLPAMCSEALLFVEEQLEDLKKFSLQHVNISRAVRCKCPINQRPCQRHKKKSCPRTSCHHFAELVDGEVPQCPLESQPSVDAGPVLQYFKCIPFQYVQAGRTSGSMSSPLMAMSGLQTTLPSTSTADMYELSPSLEKNGRKGKVAGMEQLGAIASAATAAMQPVTEVTGPGVEFHKLRQPELIRLRKKLEGLCNLGLGDQKDLANSLLDAVYPAGCKKIIEQKASKEQTTFFTTMFNEWIDNDPDANGFKFYEAACDASEVYASSVRDLLQL
ncbi:uncharacterized protein LOC135817312 [Sycon ciliatum]|uniref:uncharacterized protein LOC135817312 n=1 Tax=Sycon ciliatum TaxID=27933 RepID=UPI0031F68D35